MNDELYDELSNDFVELSRDLEVVCDVLDEAAELLHCKPREVPSEIKRLKIQKMHEERLEEERMLNEGGPDEPGYGSGV